MCRSAALASLFALSCLAAPVADLVVSPAGSDANPGTLEQPFATLTRARDAVRALGQPDRDVVVWLRGGEYRLGETVVFGLADGAAAGHTISYAAYPGEKPVFTSGVPVDGLATVGRAARRPSGRCPRQGLGGGCLRDPRPQGRPAGPEPRRG